MKPFRQEKMYYSITEVAESFQVKPSLLRYWEREFDFINPHKSLKGTRQYTKEDIESIRLVFHLVKERGLTLAGAKQKLKENKEGISHTEEIVRRLKGVREELMALKEEFDELDRMMPEGNNN